MNDQTNDDPKEMSAENKAENADDQSTDSPVVDEAETENDGASEEVSELDQLAQLQAEVEKYKDLALRAEAEMQNLRRRAERDVQNAHKFGSERLLQNLLPVLDSLEKAIEASEAERGAIMLADDNGVLSTIVARGRRREPLELKERFSRSVP